MCIDFIKKRNNTIQHLKKGLLAGPLHVMERKGHSNWHRTQNNQILNQQVRPICGLKIILVDIHDA